MKTLSYIALPLLALIATPAFADTASPANASETQAIKAALTQFSATRTASSEAATREAAEKLKLAMIEQIKRQSESSSVPLGMLETYPRIAASSAASAAAFGDAMKKFMTHASANAQSRQLTAQRINDARHAINAYLQATDSLEVRKIDYNSAPDDLTPEQADAKAHPCIGPDGKPDETFKAAFEDLARSQADHSQKTAKTIARLTKQRHESTAKHAGDDCDDCPKCEHGECTEAESTQASAKNHTCVDCPEAHDA